MKIFLLFSVFITSNFISAQTCNFDYSVHFVLKNLDDILKPPLENDIHINSNDTKIKLLSQGNFKNAYLSDDRNSTINRFEITIDKEEKSYKYLDSSKIIDDIKKIKIKKVEISEISKYILLVKLFSREHAKVPNLELTIEIAPFEINYLNLLMSVGSQNDQDLLYKSLQHKIKELYGDQKFILKSCFSDYKNGHRSKLIISQPKKDFISVKI